MSVKSSRFGHFRAVIAQAWTIVAFVGCVAVAALGLQAVLGGARFPPAAGIVAMALSAGVVFALASRFLTILPGLFGIGALKVLLTLGNDARHPATIAPTAVITASLLMLAIAIAVARLHGWALSVIDRVAVVVLVLACAGAIIDDRSIILCLIVMVVVLIGTFLHPASLPRRARNPHMC